LLGLNFIALNAVPLVFCFLKKNKILIIRNCTRRIIITEFALYAQGVENYTAEITIEDTQYPKCHK